MLREISEEIRINLKDRLRDVRHVVRRHRHDSAANPARQPDEPAIPSPLRGIEGLLGRAASVFDDAMSIAETLVPHERPSEAEATKGFAAYFPAAEGHSPLAGERAFRRDMYYLVKAVLARRRIEGALIHEAALTAAHAALRRKRGDLIAELARREDWAKRVSLAAALSAALLLELLEQRPLNLAEATGPDGAALSGRASEISCLAPVALATGLATFSADGTPEPDLLEISILACDARLDRIRPACDRDDPLGELTTVFATLLAHLP